MRLRYERPLPDLRFLIQAPLRLELEDGRATDIERWCPEGLQPPAALTGDRGTVRLVVPFHGFEIGFRVRLERDTTANFMRFVELGPRETRLLQHFYREIVTGRAVSDDAIITAMDTPVPKIPMTRSEDEVKAENVRPVPRRVRAVAVLRRYALLAVLVYEPLIEPVRGAVGRILADPVGASQEALGHPTLGGVRQVAAPPPPAPPEASPGTP